MVPVAEEEPGLVIHHHHLTCLSLLEEKMVEAKVGDFQD